MPRVAWRLFHKPTTPVEPFVPVISFLEFQTHIAGTGPRIDAVVEAAAVDWTVSRARLKRRHSWHRHHVWLRAAEQARPGGAHELDPRCANETRCQHGTVCGAR
jgi:hypothetical protein